MATNLNHYIPQIWADTILDSMLKSQSYWSALHTAEQATHDYRMATDPAYALRQAEIETESYWLALYENQCTEQEEEEW